MKKTALLLIAFVMTTGAALAQSDLRPAAIPPTPQVASPEMTKTRMDFLYFVLANAPNQDDASRAAQLIEAQWLTSSSDTANILMGRVKVLFAEKEMNAALELLDRILEIEPRFFEARYIRSGIYFGKQEFGSALSDLRITLSQEPRHFNAYVALGHILMQIGQEKRALEAYEMGLALNPYIPNLSTTVEQLRIKVRGQPT